jgi:hypothetical protein
LLRHLEQICPSELERLHGARAPFVHLEKVLLASDRE